MTKKIYFISFIMVFVLTLAIPTLAAPKADHTPELPEQAGIYDVPGHPNLKLKVFVYPAKGGEPGKPDKPGKPGSEEPTPPTPDCTLEDPGSNAEVSPANWTIPNGWTYNLNPSSVPATIGSDKLETIVSKAFNTWLEAIDNPNYVIKGDNTTTNKYALDGQNIVAWGRTSPQALAVSYIWYIPSTGKAMEIDTIMNQRVTWYWSNPDTWQGQFCAYENVYDAQNILTHEFGHTMGLDDEYESAYADNTMYGYGSKTETKKDTLTDGDITAVQKLYKLY